MSNAVITGNKYVMSASTNVENVLTYMIYFAILLLVSLSNYCKIISSFISIIRSSGVCDNICLFVII